MSTWDSRRWHKKESEFALAACLVIISPSELDVMELGLRAAVAYCKQVAREWEQEWNRDVRVLHPAECGVLR